MNITELARRLKVHPNLLRDKLPELGFSIGQRAIKIDNRQAQKITEAWAEMTRKQRLAQKVEIQKSHTDKKQDIEPAQRKSVSIPAKISVRDFASGLELPVPRVMQELMKNGILASINQQIDFDTASIIAEDLGFAPVQEEKSKEEDTGGLKNSRSC